MSDLFTGQTVKKWMDLGEIANTVCLLKALFSFKISTLEWTHLRTTHRNEMLVQSKQTTVGDKNNVRKYYEIIK